MYNIRETCFVGEVDNDLVVCVSTAGPDAAQKIDDGTARVAQQRLVVAVFHANEHRDQLYTERLTREHANSMKYISARGGVPSLTGLITCRCDR